MIKYIKKTPEYLQSIAAIWLILVALTIFAEVTFRNLGIFLGADQIVQNSVPAIVFLQVPFAIASGTMLRTTLIYDFFKTGIIEDKQTKRYASEDYYFCHLWRNLGGEVWGDLESALTHMGSHEYHGKALSLLKKKE